MKKRTQFRVDLKIELLKQINDEDYPELMKRLFDSLYKSCVDELILTVFPLDD